MPEQFTIYGYFFDPRTANKVLVVKVVQESHRNYSISKSWYDDESAGEIDSYTDTVRETFEDSLRWSVIFFHLLERFDNNSLLVDLLESAQKWIRTILLFGNPLKYEGDKVEWRSRSVPRKRLVKKASE